MPARVHTSRQTARQCSTLESGVPVCAQVPEVYFQPSLLSTFSNLPADAIPKRADGSQLSRLQGACVHTRSCSRAWCCAHSFKSAGAVLLWWLVVHHAAVSLLSCAAAILHTLHRHCKVDPPGCCVCVLPAADVVVESINKCDVDVRKDLYQVRS
jgi:hypothetical protein